jgi:glutamine amidotransferase
LQLIRGNTDTEWIYALFLSQIEDPHTALGPEEIVAAVERTLSIIRAVRRQHGIDTSSPTNLFISDGVNVVAVRFAFDYGCYNLHDPAGLDSNDHMFLGLWYTTGRSYGLHDGEWKMIGAPDAAGGSLLISSEPLTRDVSTWFEVPEYSALLSTGTGGQQLPRVRYLAV